MSKTPIGKEYATVVEFLTKHIEPAINKLIDQANKFLSKRKIQVGAEVHWFIESTEDEKDSAKKKI